MIIPIGVGLLLAIVVGVRPRTALWAGLLFPVVQAFYSPPLLRLVVLAVMLIGIALGWRHASPHRRLVVAFLAIGAVFTLLIGWLLAVEPSLAQGMVMNLIYSVVVASLAVVFSMNGREWCVYLMALGVWVSRWLLTHEVVLTGRAGDLYMGENANGLGAFAALGLVGAVALALGRSHGLSLRLLAGPAAMICALGVVTSGSRGAFIIGTAGLAAFVFTAMRGRSRWQALAPLLLAVVGLAWGVARGLEWFLDQSGRGISAGASLEGRQQALRQGLQVGFDNILSGVGFGGLERATGSLSAHNTYVGLFAATGLVPTFLIVLAAVGAISRAAQSPDQYILPLVVAVLVSGISLDWIPAARLGPIAVGLLASANSIRNLSRGSDGHPLPFRAQSGHAGESGPRRIHTPAEFGVRRMRRSRHP